MTVSDLVKRIQSLLDDSGATFYDEAYLLPYINQKYEEMYDQLELAGSEFDEVVVEISNVPVNTTDLSSYQADGQPLATLIEPQIVEWKPAGTAKSQYVKAEGPLDHVRDLDAVPGIDSWEWRRSVIYLTPSSTLVDVRVTGNFSFTPLTTDLQSVGLTTNAGYVLSYGTASLVGVVRGNPQWEKSYGAAYLEGLDNLISRETRSQQPKTRRLGRTSRTRAAFLGGGRGVVFSSPSPSGSDDMQIINVSASQSVTPASKQVLLLGTATLGAISVSLPDPTTFAGYTITAKKVDATTNTFSLTGVIDGASSYALSTQNQFVVLLAAAGTWQVVGGN